VGKQARVTVASESVHETNCSLQGLGNPLLGLGSLGIRTHRAPHDGSASAPTEPRLFSPSTHSDQHIVSHALRQAVTGAPTSYEIGCDRRVAPVHQGQDHSVDHAATVVSYRTLARHLRSLHGEHMYHPCPSFNYKRGDRGRS